ncbi:MAG TPA: transcription antitermination factor NusB [Vicinamibacterales bacterium]|nr:transcription antitermination factor NusB [Vicinamibacterales bacterium]
MIAPARRAAFDTLRAVESRRTDLPSALARARAPLHDERDRALAGEIATGTLRWQGAFDHVIEQFARRAPSRLDPDVLIILRMGMFQLLHLARVPASAVVDDAVDMTRAAGKRSAAGFVNAILRRVSRERDHLPLPAAEEHGKTATEKHGKPATEKHGKTQTVRDRTTATEKHEKTQTVRDRTTATEEHRKTQNVDRTAAIDYLSITLSHPAWLVARWLDRYGFEAAEAWAWFNNAPAPLTLRANTLRTSRDDLASALAERDVETAPARFAPDALIVRGGNPLLTDLAHTGLFVVQDEASQLVGAFVSPSPGDRVFDVCASPGGKSTQMAAAMRDEGLIVAADVRGRRVDLLARTVRESGATSIRVVQADAAGPLPFDAIFDLVLVDAPCSGLGTIRRDPEIRWRRHASDLAALAAAQLNILTHAAACVRPGGRLIYATCSSEPEENDEVVAAFLARTPAFHRAARTPFDDEPVLDGLLDEARQLRTLPHRDGLEAFFAVALVAGAGPAINS